MSVTVAARMGEGKGLRRLRASHGDLARLAVVLGLLASAVAAVQLAGLRVQQTGSLPRGLYRDVRGAAPTRGTLGVWCLPPDVALWARERGYVGRGNCPGGAEAIGKVVLAVAGDTVRVTADGLTVNGMLAPHTRPLEYDSRGRPMRRMPHGIYHVGAHEVWLWSPLTGRSFDSRYFGAVPTSALVSVVRPVWTFATRSDK
jgi:conjugative transfer signal peptidase TraF